VEVSAEFSPGGTCGVAPPLDDLMHADNTETLKSAANVGGKILATSKRFIAAPIVARGARSSPANVAGASTGELFTTIDVDASAGNAVQYYSLVLSQRDKNASTESGWSQTAILCPQRSLGRSHSDFDSVCSFVHLRIESYALSGDFASSSPSFGQHGFIRNPNGTLTTFDPATSVITQPTSVNRSGVVAGIYLDSSNATHGFIRLTSGAITSFDPPGSTLTEVLTDSINAGGTVVGLYVDANNVLHGFVRSPGGGIIAVDFPGAAQTKVVSINDAGVLSGTYETAAGDVHGFVRTANGKFVTYDAPGQCCGTAGGPINLFGTVAGESFDTNGVER
jgi:hypothetical protein